MLWVKKSLTLSDCMICMVMCGSGLTTGMGYILPMTRRIPQGPLRALAGWSVVAAGASTPIGADRRTVTGSTRRRRPLAWASVWSIGLKLMG